MNVLKNIFVWFFIVTNMVYIEGSNPTGRQQKTTVQQQATYSSGSAYPTGIAWMDDRQQNNNDQKVSEEEKKRLKNYITSITPQIVSHLAREAVAQERTSGKTVIDAVPGLIQKVKELDVAVLAETQTRMQEYQRLKAQNEAVVADVAELKKINETKDLEVKALHDRLARMEDIEIKRAEVAARRLRLDDCMRGALITAYTLGAAWLGAYFASFSSLKC